MTKARILIVEDESIVAEDVQDILKSSGYVVLGVATSGEEAVQKAALTHPDLVLMDVVLRGKLDGVVAAEQIRSRFNIPVVYLTAYSDDKTLERSKITEPYGYILKPFEERELHTTIEMALYKHKMESRLRESERWLATTLKSIGDAVIATDNKGCMTFMNPVAEALTGWGQEEAIGKDLKDIFNIINEKTREAVEDPVTKVLREGAIIGLANHSILIAKDGIETPIDDSAAPIKDDKGNVIGVVLVFRDITERRQAEEQVKYLSFHDKLTGIYNRAYFEEELKRLDTERQLPLSLIMGDVNGLKLVNDAFGHREGDKMLSKVAQIIKDACRKEDIVSRWGGDEFAVVLPRTNRETAIEICERIWKTCSEGYDGPIRPNVAMGTSTKENVSRDIQEILKEAEDMMYRKKLVENVSVRSSIIFSLHKTLQKRICETEEHTRRLQNKALQMGHALRLSESQLSELTLVALLYDIGKIAIPDEILIKPGPLSPEEWENMKKHPEIGFRIAQSSYELAHLAEAILAHHERWDGTGYTRGLKGNEIPLISRIIAIVNAYYVMIFGRPYKKPITQQEALEELKKYAGSQFDPQLVNIFIKIVSRSEMKTKKH